ncbi:unnamed protein product, partial [Mesorhabditis belari]|uniref:Uncharacterized protein n=1 Tax=Mesorhabditis belari TaxID=2138241 RepID=A0AAF3FSB5_9BILA
MTESMLFRPYRTLIECPFDGSSILRSETPQLARTWPLGAFSHSSRALPESPWILSPQPSPLVASENGFNDSVQAPVAVQRRIGSGNEQPGQLGPPSGRQGIYHLDSGTTAFTTRSLKSQEV